MAQIVESPEITTEEPEFDIDNRFLRGKRAKEARRLRARRNLLASSTMTPRKQLARLNRKFGKGKGAAKERAKLQGRISSS